MINVLENEGKNVMSIWEFICKLAFTFCASQSLQLSSTFRRISQYLFHASFLFPAGGPPLSQVPQGAFELVYS